MICGMLLGPATRTTINLLRESEDGASTLEKYAAVGRLFSGETGSVEAGCESLVSMLEAWTALARIPSLTRLGIKEEDLPPIADAAGNKNNPAKLDTAQRLALLAARL
jgi:alcohol dehydrogenase